MHIKLYYIVKLLKQLKHKSCSNMFRFTYTFLRAPQPVLIQNYNAGSNVLVVIAVFSVVIAVFSVMVAYAAIKVSVNNLTM
jgi:hypothetical protein